MFNTPRVDLLEVAIRGYCDGSGDLNDPHTRFLTLSGIAAPPSAWAGFETAWDTVLARHNSPPWHSNDANMRMGDFSEWTEKQVFALKMDLYNECLSDLAERHDMLHAVCTVDLHDYARAVEVIPQIGETTPHAICAFRVASEILGQLPDNADSAVLKDGAAEIFFDINERFIGHVQKEWERRKRRQSDVVSRIVTIAPVDHRDVLPIQAADFLAWHTNRTGLPSDISLSGWGD